MTKCIVYIVFLTFACVVNFRLKKKKNKKIIIYSNTSLKVKKNLSRVTANQHFVRMVLSKTLIGFLIFKGNDIYRNLIKREWFIYITFSLCVVDNHVKILRIHAHPIEALRKLYIL